MESSRSQWRKPLKIAKLIISFGLYWDQLFVVFFIIMETNSPKENRSRSEPDPQNDTVISVKCSELSYFSLVPLALSCLVLSAAGAVMASYASPSEYYLHFLQIPWVAGVFQVLIFTCGAELLGKRLSLWEIGFEVVVKGILSGISCSLLVYGYKRVKDDIPFWTLFVGLEVAVIIALLPVTSFKHLRKRALTALLLSIPLLQLYYSITYGTVIGNLPLSQNYTVWICYSYPVVIGLIKLSMQSTVQLELDERYFDAGDLLEVVSFGLADLPYRFIYFDLNAWGPALMLLGIKFSYKVSHI